MANSLGTIIATAIAPSTPAGLTIAPPDLTPGGGAPAVAVVPAADSGDRALPDPTRYARLALGFLTLLAILLAILLNVLGWTGDEFDPAAKTSANFALFAGFYVAAQVIERLLQLVSPLLPGWPAPAEITDPAARAAQTKADRANVALGVAAVLGVIASATLGLFFLKAIGMHVSHSIDTILTGLTIAAGTKPLHDFISLLQNQTTPKTGTATSE
jgi:hypothetical protein